MLINDPNVWFEGEEAGEKVLFMMRPHTITNVGWVVLTGFLLLLPPIVYGAMIVQKVNTLIPHTTALLIILFWSLFVLGGAFIWLLHWFFNIYILTNRRVVDMDFVGLFHRRVSQAPLRNIEDVTFSKRGILQNFFDFGDMRIQTAGTLPNFEFQAIPDPEGSLKQILDLVSRVKKGLKVDEPVSVGPKQPDNQH